MGEKERLILSELIDFVFEWLKSVLKAKVERRKK